MLWGGGACRSTAFLFAQKSGDFQHGHPLHDLNHAALLPAGYVRKTRPAVGGDPGADDPGHVRKAQAAALRDQQFLRRRGAADSSRTGGAHGCPKERKAHKKTKVDRR